MHKDGSIQTNLKDMTLDDLRDLAKGNDKQIIQHKFIPLTPGNIDSLSEEEVLALDCLIKRRDYKLLKWSMRY